MGAVNRRGWAIGAAAFFFAAGLCAAQQADRDLQGIKKKIEREKQGISRVRKQEGSVLQSLEKIDGELERKNGELKKANSALDSILAETRKVESEVDKLQSSLDRRREYFKNRALALYRWHRSGSPFVVLNGGSSLGALMRRRRYLETTLAYDRALVEALSRDSERQEALKEELARKRKAVDGQRRGLLAVKESIRSEAEKKREILVALKREKETRVRALKELEQAAHRLQKMMDEIGRKSARRTPGRSLGPGLEAARGGLDLPVKGTVKGGFGKARHPEFSEEVFRKGIDIEAPLGEEIRAVAAGRVVFADRFAGYGNMLIVDHGERYFTVYAHLSELLKKNGDSVARGDAIGRVGDSDSLSGAGLYFEIRKDGKPVDPLPWFRKR